MDREQLDKGCTRGILGVVLSILVFGTLATGAVRPVDFAVIEGLTIGAVVLWLIRLWVAPGYRLLWTPVCWAVLVFVAYAVARYLQADIEYVARNELIRILVYAMIFLVVLNNLHRQEMVHFVGFALVILAMAVSVYAIYQFMTNSNRVWHFIKPEQYMKRGTGTYICPNHLAGFLEMILPLGLAATIMGRFKPVTKVLLGYASLVIVAGIGVSISRGGWIATTLAMLVFFGILLRKREYRLPAAAFLVVLVAASAWFVMHAKHSQKRFQEMFVSGKIEDIRFRLWRPAVQMWQQNPWWGIGPAHFNYRFRQFRPESVQMRPDWVHNDYLNTLTDWGIAGVAMVAGAWAIFYAGCFQTWKYVQRAANDLSAKKSNRSAFVFGGAIGLLAILFHSVVDFNMHVPANAILAVTLMALTTSHLRFTSDRYWIRPGVRGRVLLAVVGCAAVGYLGFEGIRQYREAVWLQKAEPLKDNSNEKIAMLKRAFAVEPQNFETSYDIGEAYRVQSWQGNDDYKDLAEEAMKWFQKSMERNPYYGYNHLRYGMCLDWLGRKDEAAPYFKRAEELDANGYFTVAHQGWHLLNLGEYTAALPYFERSLRLKSDNNPIARKYLEVIHRKLLEPSGGK